MSENSDYYFDLGYYDYEEGINRSGEVPAWAEAEYLEGRGDAIQDEERERNWRRMRKEIIER